MTIEFPKPGDKLFGLDGNIDIDLRPVRHWFWRDNNYIKGFYETATAVAERLQSDCCAQSNGRMFIGLAYLYRHCIELQLKFIIHYAIKCQVTSVTEKQAFHHSLKGLWEIVRKILTDHPAGPLDQLDHVETVLMELHEADPGGEDFRFSRRKDGTGSTQYMPDSFSLDQFIDSMDKIHTFLECVGDMFVNWHDSLVSNADY